MTEEFSESPSTSIKGMSITALILAIIAPFIEIGYMIYLLAPGIERLAIFVTYPALVIILFWGGIALSITSDIIMGAAKNKCPNPTPGDATRLKVTGVLSILFIVLLIATIVISIVTRGRIF